MAASSKVPPFFCVFFLVILVLFSSVQSKPGKDPFGFIQDLQGSQKGQSVKGLQDLKLYLQKFGYLNYGIQENNEGNKKNHANDDEFDDLLESAIKTYQRRHRLNVTGGLDVDTVTQMMKPRCGAPDIIEHGNKHGSNHGNKLIHTVARYNIPPGNAKWPANVNHLRYRFVTSVPENLKAVIAQAFDRWTEVSRFTFEEALGSVELEIGFHGTQGLFSTDTGFDGPRGTLAHATLPTEGRFHYDEDEAWSSNPGPDEVDLESVAVHEIGHLLGLGHSEVQDAIMYAYFSYGTTKRNLHQDDIDGIRALYG